MGITKYTADTQKKLNKLVRSVPFIFQWFYNKQTNKYFGAKSTHLEHWSGKSQVWTTT